MASKTHFNTYCNNCNEVTQHKVFGGATPKTPTPHMTPAPSTPIPTPAPTPHVGPIEPTLSNDPLWQLLEQRMRAHNLPMDELKRVDHTTRGRLFATLGFNNEEEARLQTMAGTLLDEGKTNTLSLTQNATDNLPKMGADAHQATGSSIPGLSFVGDQVVARSATLPHLAAEFWCATCNVLVASRDHVTGVHKDHPFIPLRLAADTHVRDIASWSERARSQLTVVQSLMNNLRHSETLMGQHVQKEFEQLDETVDTLVADILRWRDQLKQNLTNDMQAQIGGIRHSMAQTQKLFDLYTQALNRAEPLMSHIPAVDQQDKHTEDWSLRVLDIVSSLKNVNTEAIAMPKIMVPRVTSKATPHTPMDIVQSEPTPLGVRLPDVLDPGFFNYPHASTGSKLPFTLVAKDDTNKGILVYNGRTLTRNQDVAPSHHLVLASQVFYTGTTSWEIHIDRVGEGAGRILAGVTVNGSDGEGVVWDGSRIVGPSEGEIRNIDEKYAWKQGTVLRFHLELEMPQCYFTIFYDREGIARIPLPANSHGWVPAFSVFSHQDQITVAPTASKPLSSLEKSSVAAAHGDTTTKLERQEHLISSLQQQLNDVQNKVDYDTFKGGQTNIVPQTTFSNALPPLGAGASSDRDLGINDTGVIRSDIGKRTKSRSPRNRGARSKVYSSELENLMSFVGTVD